MKLYSFILVLILNVFSAKSQSNAEDILGVWWNPEKTSRINVYAENGKYFGKIIWLKEDENHNGSTPRLDLNNEIESLRGRKVLGLLVMQNLHWDDDNQEWDDGEIYDPRKGKVFSVYAKLKSNNTLSLFAYVFGMPFLNKELVCTKFIKED